MPIKGVFRRSTWGVSAVLILLMFTLAACGNNFTTSTGSPAIPSASATTSPAPTATPKQANTSTGCPNTTHVTTPATAANVVLKISDSQKTTTVHKGDTVEIDLPFGRNWSGPTSQTQGPLAMQTPSGYASSAAQVCVWRFVAMNTGTTNVVFTGRPICAKGQICPLYIMAVPFTIAVQ